MGPVERVAVASAPAPLSELPLLIFGGEMNAMSSASMLSSYLPSSFLSSFLRIFAFRRPTVLLCIVHSVPPVEEPGERMCVEVDACKRTNMQ